MLARACASGSRPSTDAGPMTQDRRDSAALPLARRARSLAVLALACAALCAAGRSSRADAAPANVPLNQLVGWPSDCTAPSVRSLGDKAVAVWFEEISNSLPEQRLHYAVSVDSGATFTEVYSVSFESFFVESSKLVFSNLMAIAKHF